MKEIKIEKCPFCGGEEMIETGIYSYGKSYLSQNGRPISAHFCAKSAFSLITFLIVFGATPYFAARLRCVASPFVYSATIALRSLSVSFTPLSPFLGIKKDKPF